MYSKYGLTVEDLITIPNRRGRAKLHAQELKMCYTCRCPKPFDQFRPSAAKDAKPGALGRDCLECEEAIYQRYMLMEPLEIREEDKESNGMLVSSVPIRRALKERGYNFCSKCETIQPLEDFPTKVGVCDKCRQPIQPATKIAGIPHPNTKLDDSWGPSTPPPIPIAVTPEETAIIHKTVRDKWAEEKVSSFREKFQVSDGILSRKEQTHPWQKIGPIGYPNYAGFLVFSFECNMYPVHRVVYAIHHGVWSPAVIEHIDGNKLNNRISNLRQSETAVYKSDIKAIDRLFMDAISEVYHQRNPHGRYRRRS